MMHRKRRLAAWGGVLALVVATGCDGNKERMSILEQENQALAQDLERLRSERDAIARERELCRDDLLLAQQENDQLRNQVAVVPDVPGDWQAIPGGAMIAIEGNVLFKPGQALLRPKSTEVLGRIASEIRSSFGDKDIYVFGHTDSDPIRKSGWKDNRELSAERALSVVRYLQSQGISPKQLVGCGWGEHRPVASNTTADGKARNRRVEIYAMDVRVADSL